MTTPNLLEMTYRKKTKFIQFALDRKDLNTKQRKAIKFPLLTSEKFDGVFVIAYCHAYGVTLYSRTGEIYTSMKHIEEDLEFIMNEGHHIIFEAYVEGLDQPTISGMARNKKKQFPELKAYCHDHLYLDEFINGGTRPFVERLKYLYDLLAIPTNLPSLQYVNHTMINSWEHLDECAKVMWSLGAEGVVAKNPDGLYNPGARTEDNMKVKESKTYDLEILGVEEGLGKNLGRLGALVLKFRNGVQVSVGSGMTDAERTLWFNDPSLIIGKIAEIKCMKDSTKGDLREATFKGIREDKTEGDF